MLQCGRLNVVVEEAEVAEVATGARGAAMGEGAAVGP